MVSTMAVVPQILLRHMVISFHHVMERMEETASRYRE